MKGLFGDKTSQFVQDAKEFVTKCVEKRMKDGFDLKNLDWSWSTKYANKEEASPAPRRQSAGDANKFINWGQNVENRPAQIFYRITKKSELCKLVKEAKEKKIPIRASGFRHTWSDLYGEDGGYVISMVAEDQLEVPYHHFPHDLDEDNEFQLIDQVATSEDMSKAHFKIGAATTCEQLRHYCEQEVNKGTEKVYTLPLDVIMRHITYGGSNAPICHGAGLRNKTLSDLVREIEFVDPNGEIQTVNDPEQIKAAAGCFGMLGIVTAITFELDEMTYANMKPEKIPVVHAIPPTDGMNVPYHLDVRMTREERQRRYEEFVQHCEKDYYSEFFWFAFQRDAWVNSWKNDAPRTTRVYPGKFEEMVQYYEQTIGQMIQDFWIHCRWFSPYYQATITGWFGMLALPPYFGFIERQIQTPLLNALHFRRGIQNMYVNDMEFEIPIPDKDGKPDWSICQKAWWAVINLVYKLSESSEVPMRLCLEMRIMGGSNIIMAPQHGNSHGTCSIEVLTPQVVDKEEWSDFKQRVLDEWVHVSGDLNIRPHWAKEWQGLKVQGEDIEDYLANQAYSSQIPKFGDQLRVVGEACGFTLQQACERFSNPFLRRFYKNIPDYHL